MESSSSKLPYSELPVVGYLLDGKPTGFKTPVLQNGGEPAVQDADKNGIVTGFLSCGEEDIARIYKANYPIGLKSVVGKEVIFAFKTTEDTFYERRSRLVSRLLVAMRDSETMTPSDMINVMIFARMPVSRIWPAIDSLAQVLGAEGLEGMDQWATRFKNRVANKLGVTSDHETPR
ncbi:hypothetical protein QA649_27055 [Bradyrhizobium sp. CB1717]|uniref:hypothetical protein n=1 Tax=Bradyrhizobium sp. CB1717 TaxID=3039154 RepID=UPI0024B252E3|nr:hypothetical protein [Bradyrhizobium sp. CB1717]WFU21755.1 hypothetical protein QA649_27055 [Bradyrhizobium sp. CB1717]